MSTLTVKKGDLFKRLANHGPCVVPHCCNDLGIMGSGFVVPLQKIFPTAKSEYELWYERNKTGGNNTPFELGRTQFVRVNDKVVIANMIGQHKCGYDENGNPPVRYLALAKCMEQVGNYALARNLEIVTVRFGSGLAGGNIQFIEDLMTEIWVWNNIPVTIYEI